MQSLPQSQPSEVLSSRTDGRAGEHHRAPHFKHHSVPLRFHDLKLLADPKRVVVRPFELAWQARQSEPSRAVKLVDDVLGLATDHASAELQEILAAFGDRHWQIENFFETRFSQIADSLHLDDDAIKHPYRKLIGAYFCHEYSFAAAALMNPSIVPHPDQSQLDNGAIRVIISMRAVGEGHISSITFREGIIEPGAEFALWPTSGPALSADVVPYAGLPPDAVAVARNTGTTIANCVIFPVTDAQRNGLEDLRLVKFTHDDGRGEWIGTYTAYSGRAIRSELMRTSNFGVFELAPMMGSAAANKGMALFPRKIAGRYAMIGRHDGKQLYLHYSDDLYTWSGDGELLAAPRFAWEFIQIGNCGSPIEIDEGWLVLTHGVGAMRKYSIGALLLDKTDPSRILGRSPTPVLMASETDRDGYVPNVVYTCGGIKVGDSLFMPYAFSDSGIGFISLQLRDLVASMVSA